MIVLLLQYPRGKSIEINVYNLFFSKIKSTFILFQFGFTVQEWKKNLLKGVFWFYYLTLGRWKCLYFSLFLCIFRARLYLDLDLIRFEYNYKRKYQNKEKNMWNLLILDFDFYLFGFFILYNKMTIFESKIHKSNLTKRGGGDCFKLTFCVQNVYYF